MSIETRKAMVEVGQETVPSAVNANTILFAFDNVTELMQPVLPSALPVSISAQAEFDTKATLQSEDISVTVGAGGDYTTINAALEFLTKKYPAHKQAGVTATISLLSGFVMNEQVAVRGLHLGWITIESVDSVVTVTGAALTEYQDDKRAAFRVVDGYLPIINVSLALDATLSNSAAVVCSSGFASLGEVVMSVFGHAVYSINCGNVECRDITAENCGQEALFATAVSVISATRCTITNPGVDGIAATGNSRVEAKNCTITGSGGTGIYCSQMSSVDVFGSAISGSSSDDIYVSNGGTVFCGAGAINLSQTPNTLLVSGIIFQ